MNRGKITKGIGAGMALIGAAGFSGSAMAGNAASKPVKVAVVTFLTGPASSVFGLPSKRGAEVMVKAINKGIVPAPYGSEGFGGHKVVAKYVNEAGGNSQQVQNYKNLVEKDHEDVILGYLSSGSCKAIAPLSDQLDELTVLASCGTPDVFNKHHPYIFRTMSDETADSVAAARYVQDKFPHLESFTGFNQNYSWGHESWNQFSLAMKDLMPNVKKGKNPQFARFLSGHYSSQISSLLLSNAKLVQTSAWGGDLTSFLNQGRMRGLFQKKKVLMTSASTVYYQMGKGMPNGVIIGVRGPYGILGRHIKTPLNKWFIHEYKEEFGKYPPSAAYMYAQAMLATKVAYDKAAGQSGQKKVPTTKAVASAFTGLKFKSFTTEVDFRNANGHQAVTKDGYGITHWNKSTGRPDVKDVVFFSAGCVNAPPGVNSIKWLKEGMPGATCKNSGSN